MSIQKNYSSSGSIVVLYDNLEIKERVDRIWEQLFRYCNRVLCGSATYGVNMLTEVPNLNFHDMVLRLQMLSSGIKYLIDVGPELGLDHDHTRMILNANAQLCRMTRLSHALKSNDKTAAIEAIVELEKQAWL